MVSDLFSKRITIKGKVRSSALICVVALALASCANQSPAPQPEIIVIAPVAAPVEEDVAVGIEVEAEEEEPPAPSFEVISEDDLGPELVDAYSYHYSPEVLEANLYELAKTYEGQITLGVYGQSVQGRNLNFAKIGDGTKDITITGGIHAREYLSSVAVMNVLEELLRMQKTGDPDITDMLTEYRIWFLPSLNPDGAALSQAGEIRNRKANANGVDLNRNFAEGWDAYVGRPAGSSEFYKGPSPLSEPETKSLVEFVESEGRNIVYSIDMHTLGSVVYSADKRGEETRRLSSTMSQATGFPIYADPSEGGNYSDYLGARGIPTITIEFGRYTTGSIVDESQGPAVKEIAKKIPDALYLLTQQ